MRLPVILILMLLSGCARKVDEHAYQSPSGDQTVLLEHEACGAGCNAKDTLKLKFVALNGDRTEAELATIHGATKIEIGWESSERLIIGACNASSVTFASDFIRLDNFNKPARTEVIFTTITLPVKGKIYCSSF